MTVNCIQLKPPQSPSSSQNMLVGTPISLISNIHKFSFLNEGNIEGWCSRRIDFNREYSASQKIRILRKAVNEGGTFEDCNWLFCPSLSVMFFSEKFKSIEIATSEAFEISSKVVSVSRKTFSLQNLIRLILQKDCFVSFNSKGELNFARQINSSVGQDTVFDELFLNKLKFLGNNTISINQASKKILQKGTPIMKLFAEVAGIPNFQSISIKPISLAIRESLDLLMKRLKHGNLKVETRHIPGKSKTYKISEILFEFSARNYLVNIEGISMSLLEYFQEFRSPFKSWVVDLEYPDLSILLIDSKKRVFPAELCFVAQSHQEVFLDETSETLNSLPPKSSLSSAFTAKRALEDSLEFHDFHMSFESKPLYFSGRILPDLDVEFRSKSCLSAVGGSWVLTGQKLLEAPQSIFSVSILSFLPEEEKNMEISFFKTLFEESKKFGLIVSTEPASQFRMSMPKGGDGEDERTNRYNCFASLRRWVTDIHKVSGGRVVIVLFPCFSQFLYKLVKTTLEVYGGLSSQVICWNNPYILPIVNGERKNAIFLQTLVSELNSKLFSFTGRAGSNWSIPRLSSVSLFCGFPPLVISSYLSRKRFAGDVEVCTVIGSVDRFGSIFSFQARAQLSSSGKIKNFASLLYSLFDRYVTNHRNMPSSVLYLRNCPLEREYAGVVLDEQKSFQACFSRIQSEITGTSPPSKISQTISSLDRFPSLTIIHCERDRCTNFWCEKPSSYDKKTGNIPAGTVIDFPFSSVLSFYLFSHAGVTGTSKPTLYVCIHDDHYSDDKRRLEELQTAMQCLCAMNFRGCKSISVPVSLRHAELLSRRCRNYIEIESFLSLSQQPDMGKDPRVFAEYINDKIFSKDTLETKLQGVCFYL